MKEFISILISFIFMSIADNIDSAFNNYISVDAIVVCGSLVLINYIFKSIGEIGIYAHRTVREKSSSYLLISGIIGLILGIIVFLSSDLIVHLFKLTTAQKELMGNVLKLYIIYLPVSILHNGLLEIVRLKNDLKLYKKGLVITYISLISLDALVFIFTKDLVILFIATILSNIICCIFLLYKMKLKIKKITKDDINNVKSYGIPYSLERVSSKIFLLMYGIFASYLGTEKYAIHTICYSVCLTLEIITNAYQATLMIKVPEDKNYKKQYINCMNMKNKCFPIVVSLNFIFSFIYLFISHGSIPIVECFPYFLFYIISVFGLYQYETYKTLCITQGKSFVLLIGSTIGVVIRLLLCLLFLNTSYSLFVFGLTNFIDFYARGFIYKIILSKLYNNKYEYLNA